MRAKISLRIGVPIWESEPLLEALLDLIRADPKTIDEAAFFTGFTHPPLPLAVIERRAARLAEIMPRFKALGLQVGINHLATLGHLDENSDNSLSEPWQHLVDVGGAQSPSCYCLSDPRLGAYLRRVYAALAQAGPEFIWIDDDVRLESHPQAVRFACFCENCLKQFSEESGKSWTREALVAAFNSGSGEARFALRRQWLEHNRRYIDSVFALAREAVDGVNPSICLGYMDGEIPYSGWGYEQWVPTLAGSRGIEVKWRPGSGFYSDQTPLDLLLKAHRIGRISASLPPTLTDIQSEHENFPYQPLAKSQVMFTGEIGTYIAAGATGSALNMMGIVPDPLDEYLPRWNAVRARRGFYDRLVETFGRSPCAGVSIPFTRDHFAALQPDGDWFSAPMWGTDMDGMREMSAIGIPIAYTREASAVTVLRAETVREFSNAELRDLLARSVLLDGAALEALDGRGLGDLLGFAVRGKKEKDSIERLTADPLNGQYAGWQRDCRPSFWAETTWLIEPTAPDSRVLAEAIDFTPRSWGPVSGVYQNQLGGRVAVQGYYPWTALQSLAKSTQVKSVLRWLSKDSLPAYVSSFHKSAVWCRTDPRGLPALFLLNTSLDEADGLALRVRGGGEVLLHVCPDGKEELIPRRGWDGAYAEFILGRLAPWEMALLCAA